MAQPISYYQNQIADNIIPAINNSTIQIPMQLQGSLIAYDNINDLFKQELVTGTVNTILYQSLITQNVNIVNFPSNQAVTVSNTPLPITGSINTTIIGSNITQNVNTVGVGYNQINIYSSAFITSNSQTIINTAQYQEMVVDTVFGGVITGAIWVGVYGVEPQSGILTSLLASTNTATLNTLTVQRLQVAGPLGAKVAVTVNVASGSQITGVYITVEQSVSR
jgi:hypothetical protein